MYLRIALLGLLFAGHVGARAESLRITDTLLAKSETTELLGSRSKSTTVVLSRVLAPPASGSVAWTVTYERMTADGIPVPGSQGRTYTVSASGEALTIEPVTPTDDPGLAGVAADLASLRPIFESRPLCEPADGQLCPALENLLKRFGEARAVSRQGDNLVLEVKTPQGETLTGKARLAPEKWIVELNAVRREAIPYAVDVEGDMAGEGQQEKSGEMSGHYSLLREFTKLP